MGSNPISPVPLRKDYYMPYIYAHYIKGEKVPFYIGKGTGNRAWNSSERNKYWHDKVKKHGNFNVKILEKNLTEKQAYKREKEIIKLRRLRDKPKKLEELSQQFKISRERVRQIEEKAMEKLQKEISNIV